MYKLMKYQVAMLWLMFERCRQLHISFNLTKYIFSTPFGTLLGHVVCKDNMLVDLTKIIAIFNLKTATNVHTLRSTLGQLGYYHRSIKGYASFGMKDVRNS